jgi:hypothetical protein
MTNQELTLRLSLIERIKKRDENGFIVKYKEIVKK